MYFFVCSNCHYEVYLSILCCDWANGLRVFAHVSHSLAHCKATMSWLFWYSNDMTVSFRHTCVLLASRHQILPNLDRRGENRSSRQYQLFLFADQCWYPAQSEANLQMVYHRFHWSGQEYRKVKRVTCILHQMDRLHQLQFQRMPPLDKGHFC